MVPLLHFPLFYVVIVNVLFHDNFFVAIDSMDAALLPKVIPFSVAVLFNQWVLVYFASLSRVLIFGLAQGIFTLILPNYPSYITKTFTFF